MAHGSPWGGRTRRGSLDVSVRDREQRPRRHCETACSRLGLWHPRRLAYSPSLWVEVTVDENTYRYFGSSLGAYIEGPAWVLSAWVAWLARAERTHVFLAALSGALLMALAQAVWWLLVFPVNQAMAEWSVAALPEDFAALRAQWEYAHGARALLQVGGFCLLLYSSLYGGSPRVRGG